MIRTFVLAAIAGLAAACASAPEPPRFISDRISVEVRGSGPDVVLIPGLSSSREVWNSTVGAAPGRRYHLVHLNGFAGAPVGGAGEGPVAAPAAEEVARYVREAGLKKPALVGHSMGGTIAMMTAARHPDLPSRVMVVDMLPFLGGMFGPPGATPESVRPIADQIRTAMLAPKTPEAAEAQIRPMIAGMIRTEALRETAVRHSLASDIGVSARAFHELIVTDLRPELAKITVPVTVLYVQPTGSPLNETQMDAAYRASYANLRGATLTRVPESAHFIMWDAPERFRRELEAFLVRP